MTEIHLAEAFSQLDSKLIDKYLTRKMRNRERLTRRRVMRKRVLPCAACLMLVATVMLGTLYSIRYPAIPLENTVGDVSARYVPEWMVEDDPVCFRSVFSEEELFEKTDYVFLGTVEKIEYLRFVFNGYEVYKTLITISVQTVYQGDCPDTIWVMADPINKEKTLTPTLLHRLDVGDCGFFMAEAIQPSNTIKYNDCSANVAALFNATFLDCFCFAFLYNGESNQVECCDTMSPQTDKLFDSLKEYDWDSVKVYIEQMVTD